MPKIADLARSQCTGCAACANACPHGSVSMEPIEEGFLYPLIDNTCLECGLCDSVCPVITKKHEIAPEIEQHAVAAISRDKEVVKSSSSGGAFSEICRAFGDENTAIFGARFNGLAVEHSFVIGTEQIGPFRKSKYVQSTIGQSFRKAAEFLQEGRKVIFSGTPCQLAGLRSFLKAPNDNLFCIDFICHGVGSPGVFAASLKDIEARYRSKLRSFGFRNQVVRFGNRRDFVCKYEFENGKTVLEPDDPYQRLFLSQLCLRQCCGENCRYRNPNRQGDMTIADFKGKFVIFPKMLDNRNYSTIIFNSLKGSRVFKKLQHKMRTVPCSMHLIERYNPLFFRTTKSNLDRAAFFHSFVVTKNITDLVDRYLVTPKKRNKYLDYLAPFHLRRLYRRFSSILPFTSGPSR